MGGDFSFAVLRVAVGTVLLWGAFTKLIDGSRLEALAGLWTAAGIPAAGLLVTLSVVVQFVLAGLLLVGLFVRLAGLIVGLNFAAAAAVSGIFSSPHWWAFALLVALLVHFALRGGGRLSLDAMFAPRPAAAAMPGGADHRSIDDMMATLGIEAERGGNNPYCSED